MSDEAPEGSEHRDTVRVSTPHDFHGGPSALSELPKLRVAGYPNDQDPGSEAAEVTYRLSSQLGSGGGGIVDLAQEPSLGREVAIKRLHKDPSPSMTAALLREAAITGRLEHPNIVPIHTIGVDEELGPVVVMKRVEGRSWREALEQQEAQGNLDLDVELERLRQVCRGIEFAHSRHIVHRDIKPDNVMLGSFGEVYVVDWGLAAEPDELVDTGSYRAAGTPGYMSPEMAMGPLSSIGPHSDIYQLGSLLHRLITGLPRHHKPTVLGTLIDTTMNAVTPCPQDAPAGLVTLCDRACAPIPQDRFITVAEFREALEAYQSQRPARDLADVAIEQLQALKMLIAKNSDDAAIRSTFLRARIEFEQSLRLWSDGLAAKHGQHELMTTMLRYELAASNLPAARTLIQGMVEVPEDLRDALQTLERTESKQAARLAFLEREVDPSIARPQRSRLAVITATVMVIIMALSFLREPRPDVLAMSTAQLLMSWLPYGGLVCIVLVVFRRRFFANIFNRRTSELAIAMVVTVGLSRAVGLAESAAPASVLRVDMLLLGLTMLLARVPDLRMLPAWGVVSLLSALGSALWPPMTRVAFYVVLLGVPLVFLWGTQKARAERE